MAPMADHGCWDDRGSIDSPLRARLGSKVGAWRSEVEPGGGKVVATGRSPSASRAASADVSEPSLARTMNSRGTSSPSSAPAAIASRTSLVSSAATVVSTAPCSLRSPFGDA